MSREEERSLENIERLIGGRIKRIKIPGYEVGSHDTLLKDIQLNRRAPRTNKASQTRIIRNK